MSDTPHLRANRCCGCTHREEDEAGGALSNR